jgi:hypothetical protein
MSERFVSLAAGVVVEHVGDDVLVMVPDTTTVYTLSGDQAHLITRIVAGEKIPQTDATKELLQLGVLTPNSGVSRRGVLTAGALGAGIVMLAMPSVAVASSEPGNGGAQCLVGEPKSGVYEAFRQTETELFVAEFFLDPAGLVVPSGTELSVFVGDKKYSSTDVSPNGDEFKWNFSSQVAEALVNAGIENVCGNITVGGTVYQINFEFND